MEATTTQSASYCYCCSAEFAGTGDLCSDCVEKMFHRLDGRWVIARYDSQSAQWRSSDLNARSRKAQGTSYSYSYGNSLRALINAGIRTYRSRAEAIRSYLKRYNG